MYEYKFIKIELKTTELLKPEEGWRFIQIFAPGNTLYGVASYFELIFKQKVK